MKTILNIKVVNNIKVGNNIKSQMSYINIELSARTHVGYQVKDMNCFRGYFKFINQMFGIKVHCFYFQQHVLVARLRVVAPF